MIVDQYLKDEEATLAFAAKLSACLEESSLGEGFLVFLDGQLGAGKTTFTRGIMRAMGHEGAVKSPTFTIVEPYELQNRQIYHFDLYRLNDPEELEYLGMQDYLESAYLCLIEWPERGKDFLPECDLLISLQVETEGRNIRVIGKSEKGKGICERFGKSL